MNAVDEHVPQETEPLALQPDRRGRRSTRRRPQGGQGTVPVGDLTEGIQPGSLVVAELAGNPGEQLLLGGRSNVSHQAVDGGGRRSETSFGEQPPLGGVLECRRAGPLHRHSA
jgi:hypothetical protein